ncbi:thiamine-phosphate kinase, partial [Campylobacter upsaliensis]|nr:thiamine-phosphate kinase [Campylobacter upsaliensis]
MNKEDFIIKAFKNKLNGDDGAVLGKWCFSKDLFVQDVHFKRSWLSLEQIATKAMLVNISDAITMNAVPKYALLGLSLPNLSKKEIKNLQKGFLKMAKKFRIKIIGGDTIQS